MKSGIILVNKPKGLTSRDVVNRAVKVFGSKKIGHVGSLDPFASGLLILTINDATKVGPYLEALDKVYIAELVLGEKRDGGDVTGNVVVTKPIPELPNAQINSVLSSFLGVTKQLPPMYSALKYKGKSLYKYAREGIEIKRDERDIEIHDIKLLSYSKPTLIFISHVSKGTYIRALGEDIATKLGTVGYLKNLTRTKVGSFSLDKSCEIDDINESHLISVVDCLSHLPTVNIISPVLVAQIKNGQPVKLQRDEPIVFLKNDDIALAIYEKRHDGLYYSKRGLFCENHQD